MNFEKYVNSRWYHFFDILYVILLANILWIITTILGLFLFSFMPATLAAYTVIINRIRGKEVKPVSEFFDVFKEEWTKSQTLFLILGVIGGVAILNMNYYIQTLDSGGWFEFIGMIVTFIVLIAWAFVITNILAVYCFFPHLSVKDTLKYTFVLGFAHPLRTMLAMMIHVIVALLVYIIPPIFMFIGLPLIIFGVYGLLGIRYSQMPYATEALIKPIS